MLNGRPFDISLFLEVPLSSDETKAILSSSVKIPLVNYLLRLRVTLNVFAIIILFYFLYSLALPLYRLAKVSNKFRLFFL